MRARRKCRFSAFAWECSARRSNMRARFRTIDHADSTEFDPATPNRVIYKLRELLGVDEMGGTMRLGAWPCKIDAGFERAQGLRHARNFRAPPPSLRIQLRVRRDAHRRRLPHHRPHAGRRLRRDRGGSRPPVVRRLPVPSRIQIQAARSASAVRRIYSRERRESPEAARAIAERRGGRFRFRRLISFLVNSRVELLHVRA